MEYVNIFPDKNNEVVLQIVCEEGFENVASMMLAEACISIWKLEKIGENSRTLLHWACINNMVDTCRLILVNVLDNTSINCINLQDDFEFEGYSALHYICINGNVEICKLLLAFN